MSENLDDIELRSESVQDILSRIPPWMIRWGNLLFLILLFFVLFLSWLIKYPDTITAEAVLTTQIPPQNIYARISAQFDTILVEDQKDVAQNQVLAILENTANQKDVYLLKSIVDTINLDKNKINFPFNQLPTLLLGEIEPDYVEFENSYYQYQINKKFDPLKNEAFSNKTSILELKQRLKNIKSQREVAKSKLSFKKIELERNQELFDKGVISRQEIENIQSTYYTDLRSYQNIDVLESQLRQAIANAENAYSGSQYSKSKEETELLKSVLQSYNALKKAIRDWELKFVLKSKINGNVTFLEYWSTNQSVISGDLVFKVLPSKKTNYLVKLNVLPENSGKIKIGQKVNVSLWDYPEYEFGVLRGRVVKVSNSSDAKGFYKVNVSVPSKLITSFNKDIIFKQEMQGSAEIITEELRLIERLLYQFRHIFSN